MVEYRELVDYPGYRFGDDGSVWSRWDRNYGLTEIWSRIYGSIMNGYVHIELKLQGERIRNHKKFVHNLILEAFVGPKPKSWYECRHLDGNKRNNILSNLKWGTPKQNGEDKVRLGEVPSHVGEKNPFADIDEKMAIKIKYLLMLGFKPKKITEILNISKHIVHHISKGSNWTHVEVPLDYEFKNLKD